MPDAPVAIVPAYTPATPTAPAAIQGGGLPAAPDAPGNAVGGITAIPHKLRVTGISEPIDTGEIVVERMIDDVNGKAAWDFGSDWAVIWAEGFWKVIDEPGTYIATCPSTATHPVGLTDWTVGPGSGTPVILVEQWPSAPGNAVGSGSIAAPAAPVKVQP